MQQQQRSNGQRSDAQAAASSAARRSVAESAPLFDPVSAYARPLPAAAPTVQQQQAQAPFNAGYWPSPFFVPMGAAGMPPMSAASSGSSGNGEKDQDPMRVSLHMYRGAILVALAVAAILVIWTFYTRHLSPIPTVSASTRTAIDSAMEQIKESLDAADKARQQQKQAQDAVGSPSALTRADEDTMQTHLVHHVARADAMMQILMLLVPPKKKLQCRSNKAITRGQLALRLQTLKQSVPPLVEVSQGRTSSPSLKTPFVGKLSNDSSSVNVRRQDSASVVGEALPTIDSFDLY
jgi:hypothetical protein